MSSLTKVGRARGARRLTRWSGAATLGAVSVHVQSPHPRRRSLCRWDASRGVLVGLLGLWTWSPAPSAGQPAPPVQARLLLRDGAIALRLVQPTTAAGLGGARLRVEAPTGSREVPLDVAPTARRARAVGATYLLADRARALLHLDPAHDRQGLLVVDLASGHVVDAVTARDLSPSPDRRYWLFEEYADLLVDQWPNTETVVAVYDAAAPPSANARACPTSDDRCRGQVLYLPDRLAVCRAIAVERGGSCLTAGRQPRHVRRSPFVWLSAREAAWVDVDRDRELATLVMVTLRDGGAPVVRAVPLDRDHVVEQVEFPSPREGWTVEGIERDDDPSRVWLRFRSRLPQAPQRRLGIRLS